MSMKICRAGSCAFVIILSGIQGGEPAVVVVVAVAVDTMEVSWKDTLLYVFQRVEGSGILGP